MHFPITLEYQTDIQGTNPDNLIVDEPKHVEAGVNTRIVVPRHAPFFANDSFKMKFPNGEPMVQGVHYRLFRIMNRLTEDTGLKMACMVELLDNSITDFLWTYHTVGHLSLIDNTLLELITSAVNDNRPVYWEYLKNKPVVFPPTLHSHSLIYEIMAFQDVIDILDAYLNYMTVAGDEIMDIKVNHYHDLIASYIEVYTKMLGGFLQNHLDAINAHGLTALQVGLDKVDNFVTANPNTVLQERKDMALTPASLKTIIDTYGVDSDNFLPADILPLSQFGNTNFIPPSISGSFEGLGSKAETCAICQESDGTITLLGNRLDGRIDALYFSVINDYLTPAKAKQTFTSYKYVHPKFIQDGTSPNRVAQGSGKDVILVGDDNANVYYIGVTNGTLDPSKHVYCKINMTPIIAKVFSNYTTPGYKMSDWFYRCSVLVIGAWVYIVFSHKNGSVDDVSSDYASVNDTRYRYLWKVPLASIRLLNDLTPTLQNVTFQDLDGTQFNNSPFWQWATPIRDKTTNRTTKYVFPFTPYEDAICRVIYSQQCVAAQNPQTGKWALKFMSYFYFGNQAYGRATYATLDVVYEFDPDTGNMVMISRCSTPTIDFTLPIDQWNNFVGNESTGIATSWGDAVTGESFAGLEVLDDLTLIVTHTMRSSASYPWRTRISTVNNAFTRYQFVASVWRNNIVKKADYDVLESVVSPLSSSVGPKAPFQFPTGELFVASKGNDVNTYGVYFKAITGKYTTQAALTNLYIDKIVGRALTNNIKVVNMPPELGGAIVSVPSANLDTYGIEVGASSLCMNSQGKYVNRQRYGGAQWTAQPGSDDVLLIDTHNLVAVADGSLDVQPTHEILYPAAIVAQLKQQVANVSIMNASPAVFVTICDPTGYLTNKFGYLPVCVMVTYVGLANFIRYSCFMTILPTYTTQGNRSVVTGFTVIDKSDLTGASGGANNQTATTWDGYHTGQSPNDLSWIQSPMRTHYYLNSDGSLNVEFDSAIQGGALSDVQGREVTFTIANRTTRRWSNIQHYVKSVNNLPFCCTPDNGLAYVADFRVSTGGAALIANGGTNHPILSSTYPEIGWILYFQTTIQGIFRGRPFTLPSGYVDLRDIDSAPGNKTFYVYALLKDDEVQYEVTVEKRLESEYQLWVATAVTNANQIISVDRFNVFALNGHRITETKQGNAIPAASGLVNEEGQIPWLTSGELS